MHYTKYDPLKAGAFIALPDCIKNTKSCINIKNEDNFCFKYCVLCEVNKVYDKAHPEKVSAYKKFADQTKVNFEGLLFPMPVEMMDRFEEINNYKYSVNVFQLRDAQGVDGEMRDKHVDVLRITTIRDAQIHINLLYLEEGDKAHYVLIKDFDKLMFGQHNKNKIKKHFCHYCLHCFRKGETNEKHLANGAMT